MANDCVWALKFHVSIQNSTGSGPYEYPCLEPTEPQEAFGHYPLRSEFQLILFQLGFLRFRLRNAGDDAGAAFVGEVGVGPLQEHGQFVAETDEENQMNQQPGQPGRQA